MRRAGWLARYCWKITQQSIYISSFGIIPKKAAGKWRLIVDLSSPPEHSVNDGIARDLASLEYITVDDAAEALVRKGEGMYSYMGELTTELFIFMM